MVGAHAHPGLVGRQVVHPVGTRPTESLDHEVVHQHLLGLALGTQLLPAVAEGTDQFLLLGVDADDRLAQGELQLDRAVDVRELGVPVGMARALERLAVRLEAVAQVVEQLRHGLVADRVAPPTQLRGQVADAPGGPAQGGLRVAPGGRLDERLEVRAQRRVAPLDRRSAGTRPADASAAESLSRADIVHAALDRRAREAGRARHRRHAAPPDGQCLGPREQPAGPLVEQRRYRQVPRPDRRLIDHRRIIAYR